MQGERSFDSNTNFWEGPSTGTMPLLNHKSELPRITKYCEFLKRKPSVLGHSSRLLSAYNFGVDDDDDDDDGDSQPGGVTCYKEIRQVERLGMAFSKWSHIMCHQVRSVNFLTKCDTLLERSIRVAWPYGALHRDLTMNCWFAILISFIVIVVDILRESFMIVTYVHITYTSTWST